MAPKPDADEIRAHMRGLASSLGLDASRKWWPDWLFRSDHVENAAAILNRGKLLSRAAAEHSGLIVKDAGSPKHIHQLTAKHRSFVRLYFRPRTPTQYANEGIRPKNKIQYDAHMPVPVYLLFSTSLLTETGVSFSRGRLTPAAQIGGTADFLKAIEFGHVYHDGAVGRLGESDRRPTILNARHSEVIVKDELPLTHLKHIVCRSAPERDTLVNLLLPEVRPAWISRIHVDEGRRRLFHKRGTFVQEVDLARAESRLVFYANTEPGMRGPFELHIEWILNDRKRTHKNAVFQVGKQPEVFNLGQGAPRYRVRVTLNADLAYLGTFDEQRATGILY